MDEAGSALEARDRLAGLLGENETLAAELIATNQALFAENEHLTADLVAANRSLSLKNATLTTELVLARRKIADQVEDER